MGAMVLSVAGEPITVTRERSGRTLAITLAIAIGLHVPFTPIPWVVRLVAALLSGQDARAWDYQDDRVIIPISVGEDVPRGGPAATAAAAPGGAGGEADAPRPPKRRRQVLSDAGTPDSGPRTPDAGDRVGDSAADGARGDGGSAGGGDTDGAAMRQAVAGDSGVGDAGARSVSDPLALVGSLRRTVQGKPNVELVMWFSAMRTHPLGVRVGEILSCNPQWRDFIGDAVDPVKDLDGVFLFGPRVVDSSKLTVAVQTRMDQQKVHAVMDGLVRQSGQTAGWLDAGAGTLAARVHADRADRIVMTHPTNMIYVTPPEGYAQIAGIREPMSLPPGKGRALSLMMVTPWRALRRVGWILPETVSEMRLDIVAADDGGADITIEFDDQDAVAAEEHVHAQNAQLAASPTRFFLGDIKFVAQGSHMVCSDHLSRTTSGFLLNMTRALVCPEPPAAGTNTPMPVGTSGATRR
jgi:hypothetical protein